MKKLVIFMMTIIATFCCAFAFTACGKIEEAPVLVMDKRYICESYVHDTYEKQTYYVFHSDGTGEYVHHYDYVSHYDEEWTEHQHYIIHFKYTYVDSDKSAVVCFYDSIERLEGDDGKYVNKYIKTSWSELITVSENVLSTSEIVLSTFNYVFWINEDYLGTIPNFRK